MNTSTQATAETGIGQQIGNYRLIRVLGTGGFAMVYLGIHVHLGTAAAIKVLHTHTTADVHTAFQVEARIAARLLHPSIIRTWDFSNERGLPFLVMEYAPHGNLLQRHPDGTILSPETVVGYVQQVAAAVQYMHERGFIHRDIKRENMLIGENGCIRLSDFGIAITSAHNTLQSEKLVGTPPYMAPEQFRGVVSFASDQFSLGVVAYELLCGEKPFNGSTEQVTGQPARTPPPALRRKVAGITPQVEAVVLKALARQPEQRFASVQAFAYALQTAVGESRNGQTQRAIPRRASRERAMYTTAVRVQRKEEVYMWRNLAKVFALDLLIGSVVFASLYLIGIPVQTFSFFLLLCLGTFPLVCAILMKSVRLLIGSGSIFALAAICGIVLASQTIFAVVYIMLLLLCTLIAFSTHVRK